jgi:long-subunit acyl-CoA synthetase (AMP-forming)
VNEEEVAPILRRAEIKYRKPVEGYVYSKGVYKEEVWKTFHESLEKKGRALLSFQIDVLNDDDVVVTYAIYEWFVTKK